MRQANTGSAKGARTRRGLAAAAAMAMLAGGAQAQAVLPDIVPLPFARPAESATGALDRAVTGSVAAYAPKPATATVAERLRAGLDALAAGDVAEARRVRDGLAGESIDRAILTWAIASSGDAAVGSPEIAGAMHALEGWPGAAALRANLERALHREGPAARTVVEAFAGEAPQTAQGAILLAGAHLELGDAAAARAAIVPLWRESRLEAREEQAIIAAFGDLIPQADHRFRMERMLYAGRFGPAERVAAAAGAEDLAKAFIAVARNDARAGELLDAVDEARRGAMHVFARSRHLRRTGRFAEAATVMLTAPTAGEALVDADAWWVERRVLSRELVDIGDIATAYRLAAAHAAESPAMAADAEFHAGWYAFRGLGDAATGARHFARIAGIAEGPISLARAHYWLGRAAKPAGRAMRAVTMTRRRNMARSSTASWPRRGSAATRSPARRRSRRCANGRISPTAWRSRRSTGWKPPATSAAPTRSIARWPRRWTGPASWRCWPTRRAGAAIISSGCASPSRRRCAASTSAG